MAELREVARGVHVVDARQRFYGVEVGARMTVVEVDGGLLVHSPIAVDPDLVGALGPVRWVLAPNLLHHLHVGPWLRDGVEGWAAPGLPSKRPDLRFAAVVEPGAQPFGPTVELLPLTCLPITNEVVALHRPSRTLIVSDLVFNFPATAPWSTRATMRCLCGYPGCRTSLVERLTIRRDRARRELDQIDAWDFDRLIMAHGEIVERGGKAALRDAFAWL